MSTIEDQPPPTPQPERVPVWDLVIADLARHAPTLDGLPREVMQIVLGDMRDRDRIGRERYGTPLTTHNGRDHLVDAYQEQLDGLVYMRAELEERASEMLMRTYAIAMSVALSIRGIIIARDRAR